DIKSAIDETAKYPVKDTDFMTDDEERNLQRLADLEEGLYRKRLISYGGLLKEIHKELNLDDAEDGDLIHTDDEEKADEDGFRSEERRVGKECRCGWWREESTRRRATPYRREMG